MKTLTLPLKREWFEMIRSGFKTEEYRDLNDFWAKRLAENPVITKDYIMPGKPKKFDSVVFTCGYPKKTDTSRRIEFRNPKIEVRCGQEEWGAEHGKAYFVITWEA